MEKNTIINKVESIVKEQCLIYDSQNNNDDVWTYHICSVKDNALNLALLYGADKEVVCLAALLHDIASLSDFKNNYDQHHVIGAQMASEILQQLGYDQQKTKHVAKCVLNHRASKPNQKFSIEEVCVADADAMAHFDNVASLITLYCKKGFSTKQTIEKVRNKIINSYNKMSQRSKEIVQQKYNAILLLLQ